MCLGVGTDAEVTGGGVEAIQQRKGLDVRAPADSVACLGAALCLIVGHASADSAVCVVPALWLMCAAFLM